MTEFKVDIPITPYDLIAAGEKVSNEDVHVCWWILFAQEIWIVAHL